MFFNDSKLISNNVLTIAIGSIISITIISLESYYIYKLNNDNKYIKTLRDDERKGRIELQKRISDNIRNYNNINGYTFKSIGIISTPFNDRRGTPRQPILCKAAIGRINFDKNIIQYEHYKELEEFSHIWVIFVFNYNTNTDKINSFTSTTTGIPAKIRPPRLGGKKVGCLSTRSPHRPNNIGLSVCEIIEVTKDYIDIKCIDFVDGTIILDIKPYIPYDIIPSNIPLPMATLSDGTSIIDDTTLKVPQWVFESGKYIYILQYIYSIIYIF